MKTVLTFKRIQGTKLHVLTEEAVYSSVPGTTKVYRYEFRCDGLLVAELYVQNGDHIVDIKQLTMENEGEFVAYLELMKMIRHRIDAL